MSVATRDGAEIDPATAMQLSERFVRCLATVTVDESLFTDDALFDILPPFWRFQIGGPAEFERQIRGIAQGAAVDAVALRSVPTRTGFVVETEETHRGEQLLVARHLWLCEVRDGRIAEAVGYCNGGWDDALRARHAAEAPMIRP